MLLHTYFTLLIYLVSSKPYLVLFICKLGNKLRFALATEFVLFIVSVSIITFVYLAKFFLVCKLYFFCSTQTEIMEILRQMLPVLKFLRFKSETCKFKDFSFKSLRNLRLYALWLDGS